MLIYIKETNRFVESKDIPSWVKDKYGIKVTDVRVDNLIHTFYEDEGVITCGTNY